MSFGDVGTPVAQTAASFTFTPASPGVNDNFVLVKVTTESTTSWATSVAGSNIAWDASPLAGPAVLSANGVTETVFKGKVTSTSGAVWTISFNTGSPVLRVVVKQYSTTAGYATVTLDASGTVNSATSAYPSLTPGHGAGGLYDGYAFNASSAVAGSTSGYTYFIDPNGNGLCYNVACASGAQAPAWGDSNSKSGIAVLLYEAAAGAVTAAAGLATAAGTSPQAAVTAAVPQPPLTAPLLPQVIVEAGLVTASPVQPGGTLVLGDASLGLLGTGTLGAAVTWSDLSARLLSFSVSRSSTRLAGPLWNYQPGTVSILLDNSDGGVDPDNMSGPYVTAGATELLPMVPVRIRAVFGGTVYALFGGYADGWMPATVTYNAGYAELTLPATDAFKVLAGITLAALGSPAGTGATTGARVRDILSRVGWWTSAEYSAVGNGSGTVQGTLLGDTALSLMQAAADSEIGQLYVSGSGAVTFRGRQQILTEGRSNTVQAVFGDLPGTSHTAGTELACAAIGRASDDTTIANDVQATRVGGTIQEVRDAASISRYLFPRSYARSDLILQNDSDALNWAQWVLYVARNGEDRFESLAVDPAADPWNLWPQVLGREIGDRVQVWHRPASLPAPVSKDCFIAGITHSFDVIARTWLTTWTLQDATKYGSFLTLDNPVAGQLGSSALAF